MSKLFWLLFLHRLIAINYHHCGFVIGKVEEKIGFFGGDIDEQLKVLNKPPIKSFMTKRGGTIDCIDINKQPALDHPLLKDHIVQLRPSCIPKDSRFKTSSKLHQRWHNANLATYACPEGTVPIQRSSKEDLIRAKSISESFHLTRNNFHPNVQSVEPYIQHDVWRNSFNATPISTPPVMHGLSAEISIDNPATQNDQLSASILLAEGGPADVFSTIMAGWMVAPTLYGDNHTHLTVFWRNGPIDGCFNTQCPGFVQVDSSILVGNVFEHISEYGGNGYSFIGSIYQDVQSLNWWFNLTANNVSKNIGYWPREIIPYLTNTANYIAWGGLVRTPPNTPTPPMGNGNFPDGDESKVSALLNLLYVDNTYTWVSPEDDSLWETRVDCPNCYGADYLENYPVGKVLFFGGPGGTC
ncbi:hypothetical protein MKW92_000903 [Papaver armeniacum]|nr:hypothetical protein MKW92_000903 [Papaver armeniacum]